MNARRTSNGSRELRFPASRHAGPPAPPTETVSYEHRPAQVPLREGLLERGVWREPYTVEGAACLVATNGRGDQLARVVVRDGVDSALLITALELLVDAADPLAAPTLALLQ